MKRAFQDSLSLQGYFNEVFSESYQDAKELAADSSGWHWKLSLINLPAL
ncbi:MAG: DUF29 domain-containing protein [Kastovskya adunca ATA6-11-RM4]|nr:DUF29 domain-containing protein [Kastovskya adunca ATA6-11-RM4]